MVSLLEHVVVPVERVDDARRTAAALDQFEPSRITVLYVIEQNTGGIDPVPSSHLAEKGAEAFEAFRETFPDAEEHLAQSDNPVEGIYEAATELGATAIAYRARGGSRLVQLLSGDHSLRLVVDPPLPIVSLPDPVE